MTIFFKFRTLDHILKSFYLRVHQVHVEIARSSVMSRPENSHVGDVGQLDHDLFEAVVGVEILGTSPLDPVVHHQTLQEV